MLAQESQLLFLIVFFVYGLAFFVMGVALFLETSRSPSLTKVRLLWPLAVFGILHGMHEWVELFLLQASWTETSVGKIFSTTRLFLLAISFLSLALYGFQASQLSKRENLSRLALPLVVLALYFLIIIVATILAEKDTFFDFTTLTNNLIRYLLAVPAAVLASVGLKRQAREAKKEKRLPLVKNLNLASLGFGIYAFSQLFVSPLNVFPSQFLNTKHSFLLPASPPK